MNSRKQLWVTLAIVAGVYGVGIVFIEVTDAVSGVTRNWNFATGASIVGVLLTVFAIFAAFRARSL